MNFNDISTTISLLHTRRSAKARDLVAPGPDAEQLRYIFQAAMRVPDHGKLSPWRFIIIPDDERENFADIIENAYIKEKPDAGRLEVQVMRSYALNAPTLIVIMSCPFENGRIPVWEQHLSAGAACQNLLLAATALGFACNWLTDWPAYSRLIIHALGGSDTDNIAGFIYIGSNIKMLEERPRPEYESVVTHWSSNTS